LASGRVQKLASVTNCSRHLGTSGERKHGAINVRHIFNDAVASIDCFSHSDNLSMELTGFRGLFPLCGERSTNGKEAPPILSAGLPA
jgi:hypothetical protein